MTLPPGPRYPMALQTLGWFLRPGPFLAKCRERYGDVFTLNIAGERTPWVILGHPDAVKEVFTGDPAVFHAGEANAILGPILGEHSVLLLDDDRHLRQRRLLLPAFHGDRLARLRALMGEIAAEEVATWGPGTSFPLAPRMQRLTLEIILRTVFGARGDQLRDLREALRQLLEDVTSTDAFLAVAVLGGERAVRLPKARRLLRRVDELLLAEIRERRVAPDLDERDDILSLLVAARDEDGEPMGDRELRDELLTLLVAGHETTATGLSWAMERLLRQPGALERCAQDSEWREAVVHETLRLRPVIPLVLRRLKAPVTIAGHDLPEGATVAPCILLVHRREDLYPQPHAFRPERFLGTTPGTYTWFPFGGGVRRCLGASFALMEMQVVLETLARDGRLSPAGAPERVRRRAITLAPERGAEVVLA